MANCDEVNRFYQGVLPFLNVTRFHSTRVNVTAFMTVKKAFPVPIFIKHPNAQQQVSYTEFHKKRSINTENVDESHLRP